ncbi:MAG: hypothetical protein QM790_11605 [Nibricoccus sp.]
MMKYFVLLIAITAARLCAAPTVLFTYTMTHVINDERIEFAFPSGEDDKYYTNANIAVVIQAVYVDGLTITGMPYQGGLRSDLDTNIYQPVLPTRMVYHLPAANLVSAKNRDAKGRLDFERFDVPIDAKKIEIVYRIRYPNGRLSGEMQLVSLGREASVLNEKK